MKITVKIISLLLAAVLVASCLSACGSKDLSFDNIVSAFINGNESKSEEEKESASLNDKEAVSSDSDEDEKEDVSFEWSETESEASADTDITVSENEGEEETATEKEETEAKPLDEKSAIKAMNALLVGFGYSPIKNFDTVEDEIIVGIITGKLMWGDYLFGSDPYLQEAGLEFTSGDKGYIHYDLEGVKEITKDIFGVDFPADAEYYNSHAEGDEFIISPAIGESSSLAVQKVQKDGDLIYAYGTSISNYSAYNEFNGYFQAVFKENPSSIYGFTLVSFDLISGNQNFKELKASASSTLIEEGDDYNPNNLIDGDKNTAWVEAADGVGAGEWVKIETVDGSKLNISAIKFSLGFQRDNRLLTNNGWPTRVLMEFESGYTQIANFYEPSMPTAIMLKEPQETSFVKITILDAAEGKYFADTCITEIEFLGID